MVVIVWGEMGYSLLGGIALPCGQPLGGFMQALGGGGGGGGDESVALQGVSF